MLALHWISQASTQVHDFTLKSNQDCTIKTLKAMDIRTEALFKAQQKESSSTLVNHDEDYMPRALSSEEGM